MRRCAAAWGRGCDRGAGGRRDGTADDWGPSARRTGGPSWTGWCGRASRARACGTVHRKASRALPAREAFAQAARRGAAMGLWPGRAVSHVVAIGARPMANGAVPHRPAGIAPRPPVVLRGARGSPARPGRRGSLPAGIAARIPCPLPPLGILAAPDPAHCPTGSGAGRIPEGAAVGHAGFGHLSRPGDIRVAARRAGGDPAGECRADLRRHRRLAATSSFPASRPSPSRSAAPRPA